MRTISRSSDSISFALSPAAGLLSSRSAGDLHQTLVAEGESAGAFERIAQLLDDLERGQSLRLRLALLGSCAGRRRERPRHPVVHVLVYAL